MSNRFKFSVLAGFIISLFFYIKFQGEVKQDVNLVLCSFVFIFLTACFYFRMFANINNTKFKYRINRKTVIFTTAANHYVNSIVNVGGSLYLLEDTLVFQTNLLNITAKHEVIIPLSSITAVKIDRTLGLIDNFTVETQQGNEKFTSGMKDVWKEHIEEAITRLKAEFKAV